MAVVSSCRKVSCYFPWKGLFFLGKQKVRQRARPVSTIANESFEMIEHIVETAFERRRKVQATVGLYAPNLLGYTRATMVRTMGCNSERRS
jgi:hypothetical protein